MSRIVRGLLELTESAGGDALVQVRASGDMTKFPHIAAGVMLELRGRRREKDFKEAFGVVVKELQRMGYLKKGTLKSTAKGLKLSKQLQASEEFHELMEEYDALLKRFREGRKEPYRGRVPLR